MVRLARTCPCCGFRGRFLVVGEPPRFDAACPRCGSLERHRLFALALQRRELLRPAPAVLHVVPERALRGLIEARCGVT
jgi:hypothetical protein